MRWCLGFGEGDAGWLGGIAEGRVVRQYICITETTDPRSAARAQQLGRDQRAAAELVGARDRSTDASPSDEPVAHWIAAVRGGRRLSARTVECRGDFLHAARSTVVFADALLAGGQQAGCFDPEEICTLCVVQDRLQAAGITVGAASRRAA